MRKTLPELLLVAGLVAGWGAQAHAAPIPGVLPPSLQLPPNPATAIRPSKMLSVESAATIPAGAGLLSFSGRVLQLAYGLNDRIQLEVGTGNLGLWALDTDVRAQAKAHLWDWGPLSIGGGVGSDTRVAPIGAESDADLFTPVSTTLWGVDVNLVPKVAFAPDARFGFELGLAHAVLSDWVAIAEDHVDNLGQVHNQVLVGGAYTGFGPRATVAFGLVSGDGTTGAPYSVGFGSTLHLGF